MRPPLPSPNAPPAAPRWRATLALISRVKVAWTLGLAFIAALLLNPIFMPPFAVVFGRTVFVAVLLLLAFTVAGQWQQRLMARWQAQVLAMVATAPVASLLVYLVSTGGDLRAVLEHPGRIHGVILIAICGLLIGLVLALGAQVREREAQAQALQLQLELQRSQQQRQALDAQLALLTAQIEPHFLFNTLANVQALVETGSPRASPVLRSLIAYLRAALPRLQEGGGLPTLDNEVALVRAYLELMHLRMPDRLHFALDVPAALLQRRFPAMALLTLVENAVRHGIDPTENGGHIEVGACEQADGRLRLWVQDSGQGLPAQAPPGTGLTNLRARLQGVYGPQARVDLTPVSPHGVRAEISLPPAQGPHSQARHPQARHPQARHPQGST